MAKSKTTKAADPFIAYLESRKAAPIIEPTHCRGEFLHTWPQLRLESKATALLAKAGFFNPEEASTLEYFEDLFGEAEYLPVDAAACSTYGLRPTWHGRA